MVDAGYETKEQDLDAYIDSNPEAVFLDVQSWNSFLGSLAQAQDFSGYVYIDRHNKVIWFEQQPPYVTVFYY